MKYNFDEIVNRRGSNCAKWDKCEELFGDKDILPMWIADMDFKSPPEVSEAIQKRANHEIYGYTYKSDSYYDSIVKWMEIRHGWKIEKDWITFSPGVVPSLSLAVNAFSDIENSIVIQTPVYTPFKSVIEDNGRNLICNNLNLKNGRYEMDFISLRSQIKESNKNGNEVKMLFLCNPHNPGGSIWSKEELLELSHICLENNIIIISDEIHSDIVYKGHKHVPNASLSKEIQDITITCISPSKTFNLAGLSTSVVLIPNEDLRVKFNDLIKKLRINGGNIFGDIALEAAYSKGEDWLEQLLIYLENNRDYLLEFIKTNIPKIKAVTPQGGYLVWIDCKQLEIRDNNLLEFFAKNAKLGINPGIKFGGDSDNFIRINIACPREILIEGLNRLKRCIDEYIGDENNE